MVSRRQVLVLGAVAAAVAGCGGPEDPVEQLRSAGPRVLVRGGGEVFPPGLYAEWRERFAERGAAAVDLQPLGTERGIERLRAGRLLFAASDRALGDDEIRSSGRSLLHVPTAVLRVAVVHNVDAVSDLQLTPRVLARILMGEITRWSAPAVRRVAGRTDLPRQPIVVCHASEPSTPTLVLSTWLEAGSGSWRKDLGAGRVVRWPTGTGAPGDQAIADCVRQNPGAIGYVDGAFAAREGLPTVALRNGGGSFVGPTPAGAAAAVREAQDGDDGELRLDTARVRGQDSYPLTFVTYLLVDRDACRSGSGPATATALAGWLRYVLGAGQSVARELEQGRLPASVQRRARRQVRLLRCGERPLGLSGGAA